MTITDPTESVPADVREFLDQQAVLTLATASSTGIPHAADLLYVTDGLAIFFWIRPDTVTAQHIDENPRVAFTVSGDARDLSRARGIQGAGDCHVVLEAAAIDQVVRLFETKYPGLGAGHRSNLSFYRIAPAQLNFIDNAGAGEPQGEVGMPFHRNLVFSVLRELPFEEVEAVAGRLETQQVAAGEVIVRQGAPADKFFIIVDGEVEVTREDDGKARQLAKLGRGRFFGEMAILRDAPRNATVTALTDTALLTMDHDSFRRVVSQSLATTEDFDDVVRARLRAL